MIGPVGRSTGGPAEQPSAQEAKLRRTALQLEGLFVQRMFAAMRETVPQDGMMAQSSAEQTFGAMLDEKLAEQAPTQWSGDHSLAEALYRQLRQRLEAPIPNGIASTAEDLAVPPINRSPVQTDNR